MRVKNTGLRGVIVADSKISHIDGKKGILLYRGFRIEDLANHSSFEEVVYLLLNGSLPNRRALEGFRTRFEASREVPDFLFDSFRAWPKQSDPMDVLMASVPLLAVADPERGIDSREADIAKAIRLLARLPAAAAGWNRIRNGLEPVPPQVGLSHAADFLRRFSGATPSEEVARTLDISMILQAEHTLNASTFACRVAASTGAHLYAAVAAGLAALSGSWHGGANARVMEMLLDIEAHADSDEYIAQWVRRRLAGGQKIMGLGHAVYKTFDPRSEILRAAARRLAGNCGRERRFHILAAIEKVCHEEFERRGKPEIKTNVDFYSGFVYSMMGIPIDMMTAMFAFSLAAGWCAHAIEEKFAEAGGEAAVYEPSAEYVGVRGAEIDRSRDSVGK
jgi:citrate synthase